MKFKRLGKKKLLNPESTRSIPPPPIPGATPELMTPPATIKPIADPVQAPPATNVDAVPRLNFVPNNLSRITKTSKIDRFPRIYKLLKS